MLDILSLIELAIIIILSILNWKFRSENAYFKLFIDMLYALKEYFIKTGNTKYADMIEEILWYLEHKVYDPESLKEDIVRAGEGHG